MGLIKRIFEDFFLFSLIILNVLDFLEVLPEDFDFIKKIISWTMMIYLLYHLSFSKILIGYKEKNIDVSLLIAYTLFITKDLFFYIRDAEFSFHFIENSVHFLKMNEGLFGFWSFNISVIMILIISYLLVSKFKIEEKSMLGAFTLYKQHGIIRFLGNLLAISFVAYFIFMMVFQWFTIVIDAPLVMVGLVYSLFAIKRYHNLEGMLHRIGDFGEKILEKFIELFHDKKTIPLGMISLLVLHFFTDLFVFVIPTLISIKDSLYYNALESVEYTTITNLFLQNIIGMSEFDIINLGIIYLCNLCFVFIIFITPMIIIKDIYKNKKIDLHPFDNELIMSILIIYFIFPVYKFLKIDNLAAEISGVNIIIEPIKKTFMLDYAGIIFITSIFLLYMISRLSKIDLTNISLILIIIPVSDYIIKYFTSTVSYQIELLKTIKDFDYILIAFFLFVFLLLIIIFYIPSLVLFIYEIFKLNHIHLLPENIEHKKVHDLITFMIYFLFLYLIVSFISTIFIVFESVSNFNFYTPVILSLMLIILPKYSEFFPKIKMFMKDSDKLFIPISLLLGLIFSLFFVFFRETIVFKTKNVLILIIFLVFVAISEEILFRHYLQHYLSNIFSFNKSMIIQSLFFTGMHIINKNNFMILLGIFIFSLVITYLKEKKGLFNAITMHFFANLITYSYLLGLL